MLRYALLAVFFGLPTLAQDLSGFEKILLPGWTREQIIGVDGTTFAGGAVAIPPANVRYWPANDNEIGTLRLPTPLLFPGPSRAGRLLHLERAFADDVALDAMLYIGTVAEGPTSFTTLPVIRERDFLTGTARIINIRSIYDYINPYASFRIALPRFRHHLRIYDVDGRGDAKVVVRRFDQGVNVKISESIVALDQRDGNDPSYPAYSTVLLEEVCHPFSSHTPCAGGTQWIEIEPMTSGLRYWAMVTAADNNTRQVSVKWPQ
ncbi:MAG TPA: hypothetical protein VF787_13505 [Thermoanaerobaculia bacterium]